MQANLPIKQQHWFVAFTIFLFLGCGETADDEPSSVASTQSQNAAQPNLSAAGAENKSISQKRQFTGVHLAPTAVMHNAGFGRPLVAATLFIPHGWETSGGIKWAQQYSCANG